MSDVRLQNSIMHDGSRQFYDVPGSWASKTICDHVLKLSGANVTNVLAGYTSECWIDFTYREHAFTLNPQMGDIWCFVKDPACPDEILVEVAKHLDRL